MPDLFNLNLPTIGKKGTVEQRLEKLEAYLINLTEQLRFTLANLDPEDNFSTTALQVYTSTSKGEKGSPGKSAYQYAVEQGYKGSEEDFARALSGISEMESDIALLETNLASMDANVGDLREGIQGAEKNIVSLEESLGILETDISSLEARLSQAEEDIAQLKGGE